MMNAGGTIGRGRTFVKGKARLVLLLLDGTLKNVVIFPKSTNGLGGLGQVELGVFRIDGHGAFSIIGLIVALLLVV